MRPVTTEPLRGILGVLRAREEPLVSMLEARMTQAWAPAWRFTLKLMHSSTATEVIWSEPRCISQRTRAEAASNLSELLESIESSGLKENYEDHHH